MSRSLTNLAAVLGQAQSCEVRHLVLDSRDVRANDAFVLLKPERAEAAGHLDQAIHNGAKAVVLEKGANSLRSRIPEAVVVFEISDLTARLGQIANAFYGNPSEKLHVTGMTGTNGKTTTMWLHAQVTRGLYLGTVGIGVPPTISQSTHTTADVLSLHRLLNDGVELGVKFASLEVSSHALDQGRTDFVTMPVVGFSNLSRDHLDYHPTFEHYFETKCKIFEQRGVQFAVLNGDDEYARRAGELLPSHVKPIWIGRDVYHGSRFVRLESVVTQQSGLLVRGETHEGKFEFTSPLIGQFNADNLAMVIGLCLAIPMPLPAIIEALKVSKAPPGRMEVFKGRGATIVVDYAHTPDALEKALNAVVSHTRGQVYCVFGCGGDRDKGKRPLMAQVAESNADVIVLTDDNPRTEDPNAIIEDLKAGLKGIKPIQVQRDRLSAIEWAYRQAHSNDLILVAGKGHEDYQIIGQQRLAFSDRDVARRLCQEAA
jgi:UDP-N-acetylmuramoyl-L-alanyl-D-glutamate--2,6-diaminopimelate ligase